MGNSIVEWLFDIMLDDVFIEILVPAFAVITFYFLFKLIRMGI